MGLQVRLTFPQHDGDHQGHEEQDAGTCQRNPDEDATGEIQVFLTAGLCRKREEERSTSAHGWCCGQLWQSQGTLLAFSEAGGEAEGFPWPPKAEVGSRDVLTHSTGLMPSGGRSSVLLLSAFSGEPEGGQVNRSFLMSPAEAKTSPQGSALPPSPPSVPSQETGSCFVSHP